MKGFYHIKVFTGGIANKVNENVYIGCCFAAQDEKQLRKNNIKHVVKMYNDDPKNGPYNYFDGINYLVIGANDNSNYDILSEFNKYTKFIKNCIDKNENVLIHCHAGVSRAATVVIIHLMIHKKMTFDDAYNHLKRIRPFISPNPNFIRSLRNLDNQINEVSKK